MQHKWTQLCLTWSSCCKTMKNAYKSPLIISIMFQDLKRHLKLYLIKMEVTNCVLSEQDSQYCFLFLGHSNFFGINMSINMKQTKGSFYDSGFWEPSSTNEKKKKLCLCLKTHPLLMNNGWARRPSKRGRNDEMKERQGHLDKQESSQTSSIFFYFIFFLQSQPLPLLKKTHQFMQTLLWCPLCSKQEESIEEEIKWLQSSKEIEKIEKKKQMHCSQIHIYALILFSPCLQFHWW